MKKISILLFFFIHSLAFAKLWRINRDHSEISFQVPYLLVSKVSGSFLKFDGSLDYDDEKDIFKNISLEIESSTVFTANKMRDTHLRKPEFFDVKEHPIIHFKSDSIQEIAEDEYIINGKLNLKGRSLKQSFKIKKTKVLRDTWQKENIFFNFSGSISLKSFGFHWNKTLAGNDLLIGDNVKISGVIQVQPASGMTRPSKHRIPDNKNIRLREKLSRGEITQEEFDKANEATTLKLVQPLPKKKEKVNFEEDEVEIMERRQFGWQIHLSFFYLAFMGFLANVFLCLLLKEKVCNYFKDKYEEIGIWGYLTDAGVFVLSIIYIIASYKLAMVFM